MLAGSIPILPEEDLAKNNTVHPIPYHSIEHPYLRGNIDVPLDAIRDIQVIPSTVNQSQFNHGNRVVLRNADYFCISREYVDLWVGPFTVQRIDGKFYYLSSANGH